MQAQNLLANGGFEDRNICTEFNAKCAAEAWFRIPLTAVSNVNGTAGFFMGNQYESIVMENIGRPGLFRTFIYTKLLCRPQKDKAYTFTVSIRTGEDAFDHLDLIYLSFEPFRFHARLAESKQRMTITPQQKTADNADGWKAYKISFIANGDEQYLLFGNFSRTALTGRQKLQIRYDIDNVSLLATDTSVHACAERESNQKKLYQNNYRHTPGKFLDEEEPDPITGIHKEPVIPILPPVVPPPPVVNDTLVIPDVLFKFDKSELNPAFSYRLDTLISKIRNRVFKRIEVLGHTDSLGKDAYNKQLSLSRAETVKKYLVNRLHYAADIIVTKGFGAILPVTSNATVAGRQRNRRVEIVLIK